MVLPRGRPASLPVQLAAAQHAILRFPENNGPLESARAGQARAGQGRAEQGRAGQGRAGQSRAGQGRGEQSAHGALSSRSHAVWMGSLTLHVAHIPVRAGLGPGL